MINVRQATGLVLGAALLAAPALAQCKFSQPWTWNRMSHRSIVFSCATPAPLDQVAMDDFECEHDATIKRLQWWGVLLDPAQGDNRPYYVAIYEDDGNCRPGALVYEECVIPRVRRVGADCRQDPVFLFSTGLNGFTVSGGQRYWLQISEDDAGSARIDVDDFRWSGRVPIRLCAALQRSDAGVYRQPLLDFCFEDFVDLSFRLAGQSVSGTITLGEAPEVTVVQASLVDPNSGEPVLTEPIEIFPDGYWEWSPEIVSFNPQQQYIVELRGLGALPLRSGPLHFDGSSNHIVDFPDWFFGDVDGDDTIGSTDLSILLTNFGRSN